MTGPLHSFETQIEAAVASHDDLSAEQRAKVLTKHANQLRASDD